MRQQQENGCEEDHGRRNFEKRTPLAEIVHRNSEVIEQINIIFTGFDRLDGEKMLEDLTD